MPRRPNRFAQPDFAVLLLLTAAGCSPAPTPIATDQPVAQLGDESETACCAGESAHADGASCGAEAHAPVPVATGTLRRVSDASSVCMVRNHFMGRPQIPVVVNGRTYYGCCEGCKQRLLHDPNARAAVDPISRRSVDKAEAVVAIDASGGLLYFENEANFRAYARDTRQRVD
jgi:YHS domain-containing protein